MSETKVSAGHAPQHALGASRLPPPLQVSLGLRPVTQTSASVTTRPFSLRVLPSPEKDAGHVDWAPPRSSLTSLLVTVTMTLFPHKAPLGGPGVRAAPCLSRGTRVTQQHNFYAPVTPTCAPVHAASGPVSVSVPWSLCFLLDWQVPLGGFKGGTPFEGGTEEGFPDTPPAGPHVGVRPVTPLLPVASHLGEVTCPGILSVSSAD